MELDPVLFEQSEAPPDCLNVLHTHAEFEVVDKEADLVRPVNCVLVCILAISFSVNNFIFFVRRLIRVRATLLVILTVFPTIEEVLLLLRVLFVILLLVMLLMGVVRLAWFRRAELPVFCSSQLFIFIDD